MSMAGLWPPDYDRYHVFAKDYQKFPSIAERAKLLAEHLTAYGNSGTVSQLWRNTGSGFSNVTASVAPGLAGS